MSDDRVRWIRGDLRPGPTETIGVLELRADGQCRAVIAERAEVEGRCHILLAGQAWGSKDALDTRWWSLEMDDDGRVLTLRNGSCGDRVAVDDPPRIARALEELGLDARTTMIAVDRASAVFPWR